MTRSEDPRDGSVTDVSRREWLKAATGTVVVGGFAGCSGDGGGSDGGGGGAQNVDTPFREGWENVLSDPQATSPGDITVNPWHPNSRASTTFFAHGLNYSITHDELLLIDYESVDVGEDETRVTLRDGLKWHRDGEVIDEVTADDVVLQKRFDRAMSTAGGEAVEDPLIVDWHADGEKTVVYEHNPDGVNPAYIGRPSDLDISIAMYRDGWYADKWEEFQDATTDSARAEIADAVATENISLGDSPALSGPLYVEDFTPQRVTMQRVPDHWANDVNNWDTYEIVKLSGGELRTAQQAALSNDEIDVSHGFAPTSIDSMPSHLQQVDAPGDWGETIMMNYRGGIDPFMGLREDESTAGKRQAKVRQAIVLASDLSSMAQNRHGRSHEASILVEKAHPGRPRQVEELLPDLYEQLPNYGDAQPDLAEQRLEEAGLTKEGGTWVKPDGDPLTIELQSFPWVRDVMSRLEQDLNDVGIEASHVSETYEALINQFQDGSYSVTQSWNGVASYEPLSSNVRKMMDPPTTADEIVNNMPAEFEVPPVGEIAAEPTETVRVEDHLQGFQTTPEEELKDDLRTLLWTHAYHLPGWHLMSTVAQVRINRNHFDWPNPPERSDDGFSTASDEHHPVWGDFANTDTFRYSPMEAFQATE